MRLLPALLPFICVAAGAAEPSLRLNEIQIIGTHNSYHAGLAPSETKLWQQRAPELVRNYGYRHRSLAAQLSSGVRQLEIDVFADPEGGRFADPSAPRLVAAAGLPADPDFDPAHLMRQPGFKVMHVQDVDYRSNCQPFATCLREIRDWSAAHPRHLPIFILIEPKQDMPEQRFLQVETLPFTPATFDELDRAILSVFPRPALITPDDVRGGFATLPEALQARGWPALEQARGKVMFLLDRQSFGAIYAEGHPALAGRLIFTSAPAGTPESAFLEENGSPPAVVAARVREGYLVRAMTDGGRERVAANDTSRRDDALASGAQILSTDYPALEPAESGFVVALPGRLVARCNPVLRPQGCDEARLE